MQAATFVRHGLFETKNDRDLKKTGVHAHSGEPARRHLRAPLAHRRRERPSDRGGRRAAARLGRPWSCWRTSKKGARSSPTTRSSSGTTWNLVLRRDAPHWPPLRSKQQIARWLGRLRSALPLPRSARRGAPDPVRKDKDGHALMLRMCARGGVGITACRCSTTIPSISTGCRPIARRTSITGMRRPRRHCASLRFGAPRVGAGSNNQRSRRADRRARSAARRRGGGRSRSAPTSACGI